MGNTELTLVQKLYLEALVEGSKDSAELTRIVRDRLTKLKDGQNPPGMSGRAQAVLQELENLGYIVKTKGGGFFAAKKYELTEKGKQQIA
jgi:DNA-binding PadR family transcriptional regulator